MKINVKALSVGSAIFWGLVVLLAALANLEWNGYAHAFLEMLASIYPGYHAMPSGSQVLIGTVCAILDGLIGGAILGWLYNRLANSMPA